MEFRSSCSEFEKDDNAQEVESFAHSDFSESEYDESDDSSTNVAASHPSNLPIFPQHMPSTFLSPADSYDNLNDPLSVSETTPPDFFNDSQKVRALYSDDKKLPRHLSPYYVVQEISQQFRNCLTHANGESDLHRAAFQGDAKTLGNLLCQISQNPTKAELINQRNRLGCTPIRLAATGGHLGCLSLLLAAEAKVDIVDVKCQTPLFVAVKNRRFSCAQKLLESKACPDGDPGNSSTPLYIAFMNGDLRFVLLLLEHGAHPDKLRHISRTTYNVYNPKCTSLDAAIEYLNGNSDIYRAVKRLLSCGCKTDNFDYHTCVYHNRTEVIELLFNFGVPTNGRDLNNRLATEVNGNNEAKQKLIELQENPRSLMSLCRLEVVSTLSKPRRSLECLKSLPLPSALISYLQYLDS